VAWRLAFRPFGHLAGRGDDRLDHRRICWCCHPRRDHADPEESLATRFRVTPRLAEPRNRAAGGQESPPARFSFLASFTTLTKASFLAFPVDLSLLVLIQIGTLPHNPESEKNLYAGSGSGCVVQRKIGENSGERLDRYNALIVKDLYSSKMGHRSTRQLV
jgi:hypothetical protein